MKNLIGEIHRRSLWQVLGIYLAGSWVALQVVEQLTEAAGLPDWVRPFSLALLVLGLPIVMATAFIQHGIVREAARGATGLAASSAGAGPESEPGSDSTAEAVASGATPVHKRLFTWRNAALGGLGGFALTGLLTVGYLVMRTSGIGPAGTLVAQGVLEEGGTVILADFEGPDPDLADVVTAALRIDLFQSPAIHILERSELSDALRRMQREEDTSITTEIARELAAREGYGAVIEGEIGTAGSGYVLTARIVGGKDAISLAAFRETAKSEDDLIDAIEDLSHHIRDKAGESLRTVQSAPALRQVTTSSLEALRTYTRGEALEDEGDREGAVGQYERAVQIDPDFAMAYRKVGVILGNMAVRRTDQVDALGRAYALRDRLPEVERHLAEAYYFSAVTGDRTATARAYEEALGLDPDNQIALHNLSLVYQDEGRFEEAEALLERALAVIPYQVGYRQLAAARVMMDQVDLAMAALDSGVARLPAAGSLIENDRVGIAASEADFALADSLTAAYGNRFGRPADRARAAGQRFTLDAVRGRLHLAEAQVEDFDLAAGFLAHPMIMALSRSLAAMVRGDSALAARILMETYDAQRDSLPPADRLYGVWLETLIESGALADGERMYDEWVRDVPEEELGTGGRDNRRLVAAELALARGDADGAIGLWEAFEAACPGTCAFRAALGLAQSHEAAGQAADAIEEYERYLATRSPYRWGTDAQYRGPALERLGQLYDETDDLANGAKYYAAFVELWADADDELQPRVRAAQARLEEILREIG